MAASLELVTDIVEQAGMMHLPSGEAEVTAGLHVPCVVRLEPGRPLTGSIADEQS